MNYERSALEDPELQELEAVAGSLARTPRLEQLLRYLVQRYLDGDAHELTEYNIATEVFGRKKTEFVASQDAIARVETHRLRKKLTAFYEGPGQDHAVRITIPLGTYVPHFEDLSVANDRASRPLSVPSENAGDHSEPGMSMRSASPAVPPPATETTEDPATTRGPNPSRRLRFLALGTVLVLLCVFAAGVALVRSRGSSATHPLTGANDPAAPKGLPDTSARKIVGLTPITLPFRMIAGYTGAPQRDDEGNSWEADRYFDGGWPRRQSKAFIARTGNQMIFRYGRAGDMSYKIPLQPGTYELHLYFMQSSDTEQSEDEENKAIFNVQINGAIALNGLDIVSDAMGRNVADERVIRDVSPAADGMLHLQLSTVLGTPSICAIELLPGKPGAQLPMRMVMQPVSYTDRRGQLWRPDDYYLNGRFLAHNLSTAAGNDDDVLPFERYGHFAYALPVDVRDRYTVKLRFVELYFGTPEAAEDPGRRLFRVLCNGETLLDDFDIQKEAGNFRVLEKTFHHLKPSAQGKLNLDFEPISNYATVSSIEVVEESD